MTQRYQKRLHNYLLWRVGDFLRPAEIPYDSSGPSAEVAMCDWESRGIEPIVSSNPSLLANFIQGKRSRDWHISEWRLGIKEGLFKPEEFVGSLGCDSITNLK